MCAAFRVDRRADYARVPWSVGHLPDNAQTRQWCAAFRARARYRERSRIYADDPDDLGRPLIYVAEDPLEAAALVRLHNERVEWIRDLYQRMPWHRRLRAWARVLFRPILDLARRA